MRSIPIIVGYFIVASVLAVGAFIELSFSVVIAAIALATVIVIIGYVMLPDKKEKELQ